MIIEARNPVVRTPKNATTDRGESVVLVESRHESFRRDYQGQCAGLSGIMNRWIGRDAEGELFMGRSLKNMRRVTKDKIAAKSVVLGLAAKEKI